MLFSVSDEVPTVLLDYLQREDLQILVFRGNCVSRPGATDSDSSLGSIMFESGKCCALTVSTGKVRTEYEYLQIKIPLRYLSLHYFTIVKSAFVRRELSGHGATFPRLR